MCFICWNTSELPLSDGEQIGLHTPSDRESLTDQCTKRAIRDDCDGKQRDIYWGCLAPSGWLCLKSCWQIVAAQIGALGVQCGQRIGCRGRIKHGCTSASIVVYMQVYRLTPGGSTEQRSDIGSGERQTGKPQSKWRNLLWKTNEEDQEEEATTGCKQQLLLAVKEEHKKKTATKAEFR